MVPRRCNFRFSVYPTKQGSGKNSPQGTAIFINSDFFPPTKYHIIYFAVRLKNRLSSNTAVVSLLSLLKPKIYHFPFLNCSSLHLLRFVKPSVTLFLVLQRNAILSTRYTRPTRLRHASRFHFSPKRIAYVPGEPLRQNHEKQK